MRFLHSFLLAKFKRESAVRCKTFGRRKGWFRNHFSRQFFGDRDSIMPRMEKSNGETTVARGRGFANLLFTQLCWR